MTPNEIASQRFGKAAVGGYRTEDVHIFQSAVSEYVKEIEKDRQELERKLLFLAEKIEEYREDEESLRAALVNAQKTSETVIQSATEEARKITSRAQKEADEILRKAQKEADTLLASARLKVDTEAYTLNRMQMEVSKFRGQILNMYERQMELINALPFDEDTSLEPLPRPMLQETTSSATTVVQEEEYLMSSETSEEKPKDLVEDGMSAKKNKEEEQSDPQKEAIEGFQLSDL